jgi:hypothetical protein
MTCVKSSNMSQFLMGPAVCAGLRRPDEGRRSGSLPPVHRVRVRSVVVWLMGSIQLQNAARNPPTVPFLCSQP